MWCVCFPLKRYNAIDYRDIVFRLQIKQDLYGSHVPTNHCTWEVYVSF